MATILVVDDENAIVDLLAEIVEESGHVAVQACNGEQALAIAQQHHPVLIITDIMMPIMDGYDLLQALRTDPNLGNTMVLLISANALRRNIILDAATTFLPKPLDIDHIERFLAVL